MAPQRFQITLEGHGVASAYEGERALVALERAQGFGQLKNMPRRLPVGCRRGGCGVCRVRVLFRRIRFRPDEPVSCFRGGRGGGRRARLLHLSAIRSFPAAGDPGRGQSEGRTGPATRLRR